MTTVRFNVWGTDYKLDIPKGYKTEIWHECDMFHFIYPDSVFIYVGTLTNTINSDNVRQQYGDRIYYLRYEGRELLRWVQSFWEEQGMNPRDYLNISPDTMDLRGHSSNNLFWRDVLYGDTLCIGYKNVPKDKVAKYDFIISGLRLK